MIIRRLFVLLMLAGVFFILVCIPIFTFGFMATSANYFMTPTPGERPNFIQRLAAAVNIKSEVIENTTINIDGNTYRGQTDNFGISVFPISYYITDSYSFKNHFGGIQKISPKAKNSKLFIVTLAMRNDSEEAYSEDPSGKIDLVGMKDAYYYNYMATRDFQNSIDIRSPMVNLQPGEYKIIYLCYDVNNDEDISSLVVRYKESIYAPSIRVPLNYAFSENNNI